MNREEARKAAEVMLAYANGKQVEIRGIDSTWRKIDIPTFNWMSSDYRIKPSPTYRPFKDAEECWQEMKKHEPFGWVKSTLHGDYALVQRVTTLYVEINRDIIDYKDTMRDYTFADGSVFGLKE